MEYWDFWQKQSVFGAGLWYHLRTARQHQTGWWMTMAGESTAAVARLWHICLTPEGPTHDWGIQVPSVTLGGKYVFLPIIMGKYRPRWSCLMFRRSRYLVFGEHMDTFDYERKIAVWKKRLEETMAVATLPASVILTEPLSQAGYWPKLITIRAVLEVWGRCTSKWGIGGESGMIYDLWML